jgi:uncharacterized membrane protein
LNLSKNKTIIIVIVALLALIVVSPLLQRILVYPQTDFFTELYLLDSQHKTENYPYNIARNQNYNVYLDITNHLSSSANYQIQVKFRNELQSAPDSIQHTPSNLPSLYNIETTVADKANWELPVTFSLDYSLASADQINFNSLTFNDQHLSLNGLSTKYTSTTGIFYGNLIFELWIYNSATNSYQYHERFVDLKLSITTTGM